MKTIFCIFILFIFGFAPQKKDIQLNEIVNEEIRMLIHDFLSKGQGTITDSISEYLVLSLSHEDSLYHFYLRYGYDFDLLNIAHTSVVICEPIKGKKIIFRNYLLKKFIVGSKKNAGNVFMNDKPGVFEEYCRRYEEYIKIERNCNLLVDEDTPTLSVRELYFTFTKNGKFRDSLYMSYSSLK